MPFSVNKLINFYLTWSRLCLCCFNFRIVQRSKLASLTSFYLCWEVQSEKPLLGCPQSLGLMGSCHLQKAVEASFISFMRERERAGFYSLWHFGERIAYCLWHAAELPLQRGRLRWECRKNRQGVIYSTSFTCMRYESCLSPWNLWETEYSDAAYGIARVHR